MNLVRQTEIDMYPFVDVHLNDPAVTQAAKNNISNKIKF